MLRANRPWWQPFDDNVTGLSGGVTGKDALKNVNNTSDEPVDTTSLQGHASHEREKGMGPTAFPHSQSVESNPETREPREAAGHREALGAGGLSQETADGKFVQLFDAAGEREQQKGTTKI